jgi:hypothetical protein
MYIVKNHKPMGTIGLPPMSPEPMRYAAEELSKYIRLCTNAFLPVCTEPREDNVITLSLDKALEEEEFRIAVNSKNVSIAGGSPLGVVYGAYHILKQYGGVIYADHYSESEYIPASDCLEIPEGSYTKKPLFWYRCTQITFVGHKIGQEEQSSFRDIAIRRFDWMVKNGMNYALFLIDDEGHDGEQVFNWKSETEFEWEMKTYYPKWYTTEWIKTNLLHELKKRGLKFELGHHNLCLFMPYRIYFDKRPEYFAMVNGKRKRRAAQLSLCTSNKEMVQEFASNVIKYLKKNPFVDMLGIIPEDGEGMCECEKCKKLDLEYLNNKYQEEKPKDSTYRVCGHYTRHYNKTRRYYKFVNEVAAIVKKEFPGIPVNTLSYIDLSWPPVEIDIDQELYTSYAVYVRCAAHRFDDPTCNINKGIYEIMNLWKNHEHIKFTLYEYYMGISSYRSLPYPISRRIAEDWRLLYELGCGGATIQYNPTCSSTYALNVYTFARRCWDLDVSFDDILNEYLKGMYHSKWDKVRPIYQKAFDLLDELGERNKSTLIKSQVKNGEANVEVTMPTGHLDQCYGPTPDKFFRLVSSDMVKEAGSLVESILKEECSIVEKVQLQRLLIYLEFIERFRSLKKDFNEFREKNPNSLCSKELYKKVKEFLNWEKQFIDLNKMAWINDNYQWNNQCRLKM